MFNLFQKKPKGESTTLKIKGMHCSACPMNIDGALEDTEGVFSSESSYAKAETKVDFDPNKLTKDQIIKVIKQQGYTIAE